MKKILFALLIFLSYLGNAHAQIGPGQQCGMAATMPCYVTGSGGGGSSTVNQGTQAATAAGSTWFVQEYLGRISPKPHKSPARYPWNRIGIRN